MRVDLRHRCERLARCRLLHVGLRQPEIQGLLQLRPLGDVRQDQHLVRCLVELDPRAVHAVGPTFLQIWVSKQ